MSGVCSCITKGIRYDTRCYFNVRSKADTEPKTKKRKQKDYKVKTDVFRSIGKQSKESVESIQK